MLKEDEKKIIELIKLMKFNIKELEIEIKILIKQISRVT
tara:strand:+ start:32 stop:148 length:117 start_codon:yes stop_codon:yes gene_type:complete